jgi:hypothetical protein
MLGAPDSGVTPMTPNWRKPKVFAIAIATLACTAALLSMALAFPQTVVDPALGKDWQCRRSLFFTTCSRVEQPTPTAQISRQRNCPLRV